MYVRELDPPMFFEVDETKTNIYQMTSKNLQDVPESRK